MDAHVHYGLTRRWALDAGFSEQEAEAIASADIGVDVQHPGGLLHPDNWGYHFRLFGARALAVRDLSSAKRTGSLQDLGVALHRVQDDVAHGWLGLLSHVLDPRIDVWEHRSRRTRRLIEERSRRMLGDVAAATGRRPVRAG
ncbi:MAG TPA: hypothetical protein VGK50_02735 [Coriobacteriia bacterium]|jgi:hypothetical protein